MDIYMVLEQFRAFSGLTAAQAQTFLPSCAVAIASVMSKISNNVNIAANKSLLTNAAAANAYYEYTLTLASKDCTTNFSAGDIKISSDCKEMISAAQKLRDNAFSAISHLLKDNSFNCEAVKC